MAFVTGIIIMSRIVVGLFDYASNRVPPIANQARHLV